MYGRDEHRYMQARIDAVSEELLHLWERIDGLADDLTNDTEGTAREAMVQLHAARRTILGSREHLRFAKACLPAHLIPGTEQSRRTATAVLRSGDLG